MTASVPKFHVLTIIVATAGLLAILLNAVWGTNYPNVDGTGSTPLTSVSEYLSARPFDALALVNYSQIAESQASVTSANRERVLILASQLAPNDIEVVKALAAFAFRRGDTLLGLNHVAHWASISAADRSVALNVLLSGAGNREWPGFIDAQLKTNWPLAEALLLAACGKLSADQLLTLGSAISRSAAIGSETAACVSRKLLAENRSLEARVFWLGTLRPLPPKIGHVFNGDFSLPLGNGPFNWTLAEGGEFRDGFRVALLSGAAPDGKAHALQVRFNGRRVDSALATQSLALLPGNYRLRFVTKQSGFVGAESARWLLRCGSTGTLIEQRLEPTRLLIDGWSANSGLFTITEPCRGQSIRLELSSRLQQLTGTNASAAFADVEVERMES